MAFTSGGVLFLLPLDGARTPRQLAREAYRVEGARIAPNNRAFAYRSDESGSFDAYVQPFDLTTGLLDATNKRRMPGGALGMLQWRADGRELLYMDGSGALVAARVDLGAAPAPPRSGSPARPRESPVTDGVREMARRFRTS